jgi:hypothetical protein
MRGKRWWPAALFLLACGSRTGLGVLAADDEKIGVVVSPPHIDAALDAPAVRDAPASFDVVPLIDATRRDVDRSDCPDADVTRVYIVSSTHDLLIFDPPTLATRTIGRLVCPGAAAESATPYSMAVDRRGVAYVLYTSGKIYRVSTATGACTTTTFRPGQQGFTTFGMGFASDTGGPDETLYVAEAEFDQPSEGLARIAIPSMTLGLVGAFSPPVGRAELTGTPDGRLFIYWLDPGTGSHLAEVDKATARVIGADALTIGSSRSAFAFAHWGGEFWIFTGEAGAGSQVHRYRITDRSTTLMTTLSVRIVGAGVSTCAPL